MATVSPRRQAQCPEMARELPASSLSLSRETAQRAAAEMGGNGAAVLGDLVVVQPNFGH